MRVTGASVATITGARMSVSPAEAHPLNWIEPEVPTEEPLHALAYVPETTDKRVYAYGEGGVILRRRGGRTIWNQVGTFPSADDPHTALGVDTMTLVIWIVGENGSIAWHAPNTDDVHPVPPPLGTDVTFNDVATISHDRQSGDVYIAGNDGSVYYGYCEYIDDEDEMNCIWESVSISDSPITAIDMYAAGEGFAVTADGAVFRTSHQETWEEVEITGLDNGLTDIDANGPAADTAESDIPVHIVGQSGTEVFYSNSWSVNELGDVTLRGVDRANYLVGDEGTMFKLVWKWFDDIAQYGRVREPVDTPTTNTLRDVLVVPKNQHGPYAVGDDGIIEQEPKYDPIV